MDKKTVMPVKTFKLINNLVRYLNEQDKEFQITKLKTDAGKGSIKIDNSK